MYSSNRLGFIQRTQTLSPKKQNLPTPKLKTQNENDPTPLSQNIELAVSDLDDEEKSQ